MKLDLFVDTSRKGISMALYQAAQGDAAPLYVETVDPAARGETASAIMDELLTRAGATLDDIKRVLVTVGPGSFSGLRTGVAFCQGLCFSGKRELYGVSTLQALGCFGGSTNDASVAVVFKARPGYWYLRQVINGEAQELFIETAEVVARLKDSVSSPIPVKTVVVDEFALADETLKKLLDELHITAVIDTGKPLSMWAPLFSCVKASLIQEANYIQPSYFEKLK